VVKKAVDQQHGVVLGGRAFDVATCCRRQIRDAFELRAVLELKRRPGENRHGETVSVHCVALSDALHAHLGTRDLLSARHWALELVSASFGH
jgi:hypothetical protein